MTPAQGEFVAVGDQLQSAASRMAEWIRRVHNDDAPYEVHLAALEAETAVWDWTELRRKSAGPLLDYRRARSS